MLDAAAAPAPRSAVLKARAGTVDHPVMSEGERPAWGISPPPASAPFPPRPVLIGPVTILPDESVRRSRRSRAPVVLGGAVGLVVAVVASTRVPAPAGLVDVVRTPVAQPAATLPAASPPVGAPVVQPSVAAQPEGAAVAVLSTLTVKGRAPLTGYSRGEFGPRWADVDRNGCDTRNDILARDLTLTSFHPGTRGCVVVGGRLADPYTGRTITFSKTRASEVQIDHVVSLSNAWQTGAFTWPAERRRAFGNDPLNLLAVSSPANAAKSDGDAATWLPPNKAYRCALVARQTAVKAKWNLWATPAERDAIDRVLAGCLGFPAPTGGLPAP